MNRNRMAILDDLRELHRQIDEDAWRLVAKHGERIRCGRGCDSCCVDELTVFEVEAARIIEERPEVVESADPRPPGACAFLGSGGECRIYEQRPYVCRTQGLPLRWIAESSAGLRGEYRDICPLNDEPGPGLESLPESACWTLGPVEGRLAGLQARWGEPGRRIRLRDLFRTRGTSLPE